MILLWGLMEDSPMRMVYEELIRAKADIFYLDHRDIFNCDIETIYDGTTPKTVIRSKGRTLDLSEISAAYIRPYDLHDYDEAADKTNADALVHKASGFEMHIVACLDASGAYIINKSASSATNNSKPLQLSLIRKAGFGIPITFVTNDPTKAGKFLEEHPDSIFKSVSGLRSIVERVSAKHLSQLNDVKWCPTLFQEVVPGHNYRVHVISDKIFAVRIESDRLDYRYGNTTMTAVELPEEVAQKCRRITADLGLHLSGIDLMRTPDDKWYCFEVNPSPAYVYFQQGGGQLISEAIADALIAAPQLHQLPVFAR